MNVKIKGFVATVWEFIGIVAIGLLLHTPEKKTIIDMIMDSCGIQMKYYGNLSYITVVFAGIFLLVYLTSFKLFAKEKITKLFLMVSSFLMILTLISLVIF